MQSECRVNAVKQSSVACRDRWGGAELARHRHKRHGKEGAGAGAGVAYGRIDAGRVAG
jgi:hypothetical protein